MGKERNSTIHVQGTAIAILNRKDDDFISLTDMAKKFGGDDLIYSWMRNRNTLEFLGIWERIHNPSFKGVEFDTFKTGTCPAFVGVSVRQCGKGSTNERSEKLRKPPVLVGILQQQAYWANNRGETN